jgi:multidrug efflux pump subunit AcrB
MQPVIDQLDLAPGHRVEIGGEIKEGKEANEKLFANLPICGLLIVLLLIWQFNSFRRPAIIMLTIPMAFVGSMVGLLLMRAPFDFFAILGLLSLAGVIINNGIVLIDRIDGMRAEGVEAFQAIVEATVSRCRPIVMSAVTTILGVLPLIVFHDPLFYSMACIIAFGLALGTVLSLLVVPVIYSVFFQISHTSGTEPQPSAEAGGTAAAPAG